MFPDPKAAAECHGGLRTFVGVTVQFVGRVTHRERIGQDEHHVRGRALPQRAVKLLRSEMGRTIREDDSTETAGNSAQFAPGREIRRAKYSVIARRTSNSK